VVVVVVVAGWVVGVVAGCVVGVVDGVEAAAGWVTDARRAVAGRGLAALADVAVE
jgi:hypothetical protein